MKSWRHCAWTAAPAALAAVGLLLASSPASAQISRVGQSKDVVANGASLIGNDVCYDPVNKIYFGTIAHGYVYGAFMNTSGDVISSFRIGSALLGKPWGHYPRCVYSPELNNGSGGFLAIWHQDDAVPNVLHSVVISYPSGVVSSESVISDGTQFGTFYQNGAAIAYSPTSHKILVAWSTYSWNIQGRFVDARTGAPLGGGPMTFVTNPGGDAGWRDPSVAWNPATDEFGIAYAGWSGSSCLLGLVRVKAADGSSSTVVNFGHGPVGTTPSIGVNGSNRYVIGWSAAGGARSQEFDQAGNAVGASQLISTRMGTALSFALAFNPVSGTFLAVSEDLGGTPDIAGVELSPSGTPYTAAMALTNGGTLGSYVPRVIARTDAAEWNISYSRNYLNGLNDQIISTATRAGALPNRRQRNSGQFGDFNGDGKHDITVFRPSDGVWYVRGLFELQWGAPGDVPVPGDYDGNGVTDAAVWRPSTGVWHVRGQFEVQWGSAGDVPVPGDYNGDGVTDVAVWRPSTGEWYVRNQFTVPWGGLGDMPVAGDYNGDGVTDVAVWRPSTGEWYVRNQFTVQWGGLGDRPVAGDYNGDGKVDIAVYRPSTGQWFVQGLGDAVQWGGLGDLPVPRPEVPGDLNGDGVTDVAGYLPDFDGNGSADIAVYRRSTGEWLMTGHATVQWGALGDIPVPGDYNGDGTTERAVYRPSTGEWFVSGHATVQWGGLGDIPVPGDYNGDGTTERAVYRPATGQWFVQGQAPVHWGGPGDVPVPGKYDGNATTDIAVYRPSTGQWFVRNRSTVAWGAPGDIPAPGDYNGDGVTDISVYRPSTCQWFVVGLAPVQWGGPGDLPVPGDFNGDNVTDFAVFRPSSGFWFVRGLFTVQWGGPGDIPASRAYTLR